MASAEITIDRANKLFNTSFSIKQFIVHNNSTSNIYIKRGGVPPTIKDYDYVVAPNSDFTSGQIKENSISIFTNALDFRNPAKIQAYDYLYTQPNNTPYLTNQTVTNNTQYPVTVRPVAFGGIYSVFLPTIKVDNFSNINFTFKGGSLDSINNPNANLGGAYMLISGVNSFEFMPDGGGSSDTSDSVVSINAPFINSPFTPQLLTPLPLSEFTINQIVNNQFVIKPNINVYQRFEINQVVPVKTTFFWGVVKPPAFYYALYPESGGNYNFDITIETYDPLMQQKITILPTTNFTGVSPNPVEGYLIKPKLINNIQYRFIKTTITNNLFGSPNIHLPVWNYSS